VAVNEFFIFPFLCTFRSTICAGLGEVEQEFIQLDLKPEDLLTVVQAGVRRRWKAPHQ
jgi:hypothetical protein